MVEMDGQTRRDHEEPTRYIMQELGFHKSSHGTPLKDLEEEKRIQIFLLERPF